MLTENLFGGQLSQNLQQLQPFNQQNHNNFFCNKNTQQANEFNFFLQGVQSKNNNLAEANPYQQTNQFNNNNIFGNNNNQNQQKLLQN